MTDWDLVEMPYRPALNELHPYLNSKGWQLLMTTLDRNDLNDIERWWKRVKKKHFCNKVHDRI